MFDFMERVYEPPDAEEGARSQDFRHGVAIGARGAAYGHITSGGRDISIASTLPPVRSPNCVPRS